MADRGAAGDEFSDGIPVVAEASKAFKKKKLLFFTPST